MGGCYIFNQSIPQMNITKQNIDDLNAVITLEIVKEDYHSQVEKTLRDYQKSANIPGFRKGHVPMGMIKKQYGKAVLLDEINKIIQQSLNKYLTDEKLEILGNPLPVENSDFDLDKEDFKFDFELGLSPKFEVDLNKKTVTKYKVVADKKFLDNQIKSIRKQFGKLIAKDKVEKEDEITGTFVNEEKNINHRATFSLDRIKGKKQLEALLGKKPGDTVSLATKDLFVDDHDNQHYLGVSHDDAHGLDIEVTLTIEEVNTYEEAEINQELLDKVFGKDVVKSEGEARERIKADAERQFMQYADQVLLNNMVDSLIENTAFDLPKEFLIKWLQKGGEEEMTADAAIAEYERTEKGLRYQLIEAKLMNDNNLYANFEDLKSYTQGMIASQMAQFGRTDATDKELEDIAARILSNQDEVRRLAEQLNRQKLLDFFKANANLKEKEIAYDKFTQEVYH